MKCELAEAERNEEDWCGLVVYSPVILLRFIPLCVRVLQDFASMHSWKPMLFLYTYTSTVVQVHLRYYMPPYIASPLA